MSKQTRETCVDAIIYLIDANIFSVRTLLQLYYYDIFLNKSLRTRTRLYRNVIAYFQIKVQPFSLLDAHSDYIAQFLADIRRRSKKLENEYLKNDRQ